jgi:hypothetical protein
MTVTTTARRQQFVLDGSEDEFTFTFRALTAVPTDIKCIATVYGNDTDLQYTTDYSVVVNTNGVGGTVTLVSPATVGSGVLTVYRETTNKQESDYDDYNQFPADTLENDLDIRTLVAQELSETQDRTVLVAISTPAGINPVLPVPAANKVIGWDSAGTSMENKDPVGSAADAASAAASAASAAASAASIGLTWGNDSYARLLLHGDGTVFNDKDIIDSSVYNNRITVVGGANLDVDTKEFGSSSIKFNGTTGYLTVPSDQKLTNGSFETWTAGDAVAPDDWTLSGAGAAVAKEATTIKVGTYSAKLTRNGTDCYVFQDVQNSAGLNIAYWKGKTATVGIWVWASVDNRAMIQISDGVTSTASQYHTGDSTWQYLTVTKTISSSATNVYIQYLVLNGDTTAYFDGAFVTDDAAANFNFGSGDFTIDTWAYFTDVTTVSRRVICSSYQTTLDNRAFVVSWNQSGSMLEFVYSNTGAGAGTILSFAWTPVINTWYHIEFVKSGTNAYFHKQ